MRWYVLFVRLLVPAAILAAFLAHTKVGIYGFSRGA
jgi:hypothetical protein